MGEILVGAFFHACTFACRTGKWEARATPKLGGGVIDKKGAARERMPSLRRDRLCRRRAADKDRTLCP